MPPTIPKKQGPRMNLDKVLPISQMANVYRVKYRPHIEVLHNVNLDTCRALGFKALSYKSYLI